MSNAGHESTHNGPVRVIFDIVWEAEWPGFCQDIDDSMVIVFDPIDRESPWEFVPRPEHTHAATITVGEFEAKYFCTLDLNKPEITNVILIAMDDDMSMEVYGDADCPVLGRECPAYSDDKDLDRTCFEFTTCQDRNGNDYLEFQADFHLNHQWPEGLLIWASKRIGEDRVDIGAQGREELDELLGHDIRDMIRVKRRHERNHRILARDQRILQRRQENRNRHQRNLGRRRRDLERRRRDFESSDESYLADSSSSSEQSSSDESAPVSPPNGPISPPGSTIDTSDHIDDEMEHEERGPRFVVHDEEDEGGYGSVDSRVGSTWWRDSHPGDNLY